MVTGGQLNLAAVGILGYLACMETTPAEHDFDAASAQGVFGPYLRGLRLAARLSQRELADRSGVSARTISDLERGVWRTPRADSAAMLAAALDLDAPAIAVWDRIIRTERPTRRRGAITITPLPDARFAIMGRDQSLEQIIQTLELAGGRVVTVTGPGGIGKTRLAREIAQRWLSDRERSGVVAWVELAGLSDPIDVLPEIGRALGLTHLDPAAAGERIAATLGANPGLLILDNLEHLLAAAPGIGRIAAASPQHAVLVTSRQPLGVQGEEVCQLPPLELPSPRATEAALAASPPIACFLSRAHLGQDALASPRMLRDAARIVRLLDGMPLAIELAAAQTAILPVGAIADLLEYGGLHLLEDTGTAAAGRQRTMTRAIAWSVDLLEPDTRRAFRLLSVFRGGMSLSLALELLKLGQVRNPQQELLALVRASLLAVRGDADDDPRYVMLEPIRLAGRRALEDMGEVTVALDLHAAIMRQVAERARSSAFGTEPRRGFDLARLERSNLCAALDHAIDRGDDALACGIANCLGWLWEMLDEEAQAVRWFQRVGAMEPRATTAADRFTSATWELHYALLWRHPDYASVARLHRLARTSGGREDQALAHVYDAASSLFFEGLCERADRSLQLALDLAGNDHPSFARSVAAQVSGFVSLFREQYADAERWFSAAILQRRALGMTAFTPYLLALLGYARFRLERPDAAAGTLIESLRIALDIRHTMSIQVSGIVLAALALSEPDGRQDSERARLAGHILGASLKLDDRLWREDDFASALARDLMAAVRSELGDDGIDEAIGQGESMDDAALFSRAMSVAQAWGAGARTLR